MRAETVLAVVLSLVLPSPVAAESLVKSLEQVLAGQDAAYRTQRAALEARARQAGQKVTDSLKAIPPNADPARLEAFREALAADLYASVVAQRNLAELNARGRFLARLRGSH
jgi:hypothetical protein